MRCVRHARLPGLREVPIDRPGTQLSRRRAGRGGAAEFHSRARGYRPTDLHRPAPETTTAPTQSVGAVVRSRALGDQGRSERIRGRRPGRAREPDAVPERTAGLRPLLATREREPQDRPLHAAPLLEEAAGVVGQAVLLAEFLHPRCDVGVLRARHVRVQVVLHLERQVAAHQVERRRAVDVGRAEQLADVPGAWVSSTISSSVKV